MVSQVGTATALVVRLTPTYGGENGLHTENYAVLHHLLFGLSECQCAHTRANTSTSAWGSRGLRPNFRSRTPPCNGGCFCRGYDLSMYVCTPVQMKNLLQAGLGSKNGLVLRVRFVHSMFAAARDPDVSRWIVWCGDCKMTCGFPDFNQRIT